MKKMISILFVACFLSLMLCACMQDAAKDLSNDMATAASELMDGENGQNRTDDNQGLLDDNREDVNPTNTEESYNDGATSYIGSNSGDNNGEVNDGDGYVGDNEDHPGVDDNQVPDSTTDEDSFI